MVEDIKFLWHSYAIIPSTLELASKSISYGSGYMAALHIFGFVIAQP